LCVIKRTVTDFYVEKKVVPACKKLLPVIRERKNSMGGAVFKKGTPKNWIAKARKSFW
jgi:hypothetical protein